MIVRLLQLFALALLAVTARAEETKPAPQASAPAPVVEKPAAEAVAVQTATAITAPVPDAKPLVYVIPVRDQIDEPVLYVLRRGLKEATERHATAVVLDMDTPGGRLDTTFKILEALEKFPGKTATYINKDAISAGAFISAGTHDIYFSPKGVIGASTPVNSAGKDIDKDMRDKVMSYLMARIRSMTEGKGYRGQVISAMIDGAMDLKIGDKVVNKIPGKPLSLTATEAMEKYGEPPQVLLGAGIYKSIDELIEKEFNATGTQVVHLKATWSEDAASVLSKISPILLGLGLLSLFIEFKTPGFGFFGVAGIVLVALVFMSNYVAGLSGHEPALLFVLGLVLIAVEIFFFPGVAIMAVTGLLMMIAALLWSMADIWPNEPIQFSGTMFIGPLQDVGLGLLIASGAGVALIRFMPKGLLWDRMIIAEAVTSSAQVSGGSSEVAGQLNTIIGQRGIAATALRPMGQVEIDGRRYEAKVEVGSIDAGTPIVVRARTDFGLVVEKEDAA